VAIVIRGIPTPKSVFGIVVKGRPVVTAPVAIVATAVKITPNVVMIVAMTFAVVQQRPVAMVSAVITTVESAATVRNAATGQ